MYFIKGLLFGLMLQLSIGPVCFAVLHKSMTRGYKEGFKMVLGVTLIDGLYILISFTSISGLLKILFIKKIIMIVSGFVLIMFGYTYIKNARNKEMNITPKEIENNDENSFIYALKLTSINPLTIVFWSGIFASLVADDSMIKTSNLIIYSLGCLSATVLFLGIISLIGNIIVKYMNNNILKIMDYTIGVLLIAFGIKILI